MNTLGIILAGGKSSRMGKDKALLTWENQSLLDFQIKKLSELFGLNSVIVSGERTGYNCIKDIILNRGPVEALRSILKSLTDHTTYPMSGITYDSLLILPVDMPLISTRALAALLNQTEKYDVIKFSNYQLPAVFQNLNRLNKIIDQMDLNTPSNNSDLFSFKEIYRKLNVLNLSISINEQMLNTNTPEEWNEAISATNAAL